MRKILACAKILCRMGGAAMVTGILGGKINDLAFILLVKYVPNIRR